MRDVQEKQRELERKRSGDGQRDLLDSGKAPARRLGSKTGWARAFLLPATRTRREADETAAFDRNGAGGGRGGSGKGAAAMTPSRSGAVWDLASPHEVELGSGDSCPWRRGRAPLVPAEAGEGEREIRAEEGVEGREEEEREGTGHGEPREIASWWRWSSDARRGGGQGRAGLVQEEEERCGIGLVGQRRKTREVVGAIWLGGMDPDGDLVEWRRGWEDGTGP